MPWLDGKKHGVDIGKLHEAAMFYLPSKRPGGFIVHIHQGRKPTQPAGVGEPDSRRPTALATAACAAPNAQPWRCCMAEGCASADASEWVREVGD